MRPYRVPTAVAAQVLGKSEDYVRWGLREGRLPIGNGQKRGKERWSYYISPHLLMQYTGIPEAELRRLIDEYHEERRSLYAAAFPRKKRA